MAKIPPCDCVLRAHCPLQNDPLKITYLDGEQAYRPLTAQERVGEQIMKSGFSLREAELGDFVGADDKGNVWLLARALDPQRAVDHAMAIKGHACKDDEDDWPDLEPAPEDDTVASA